MCILSKLHKCTKIGKTFFCKLYFSTEDETGFWGREENGDGTFLINLLSQSMFWE